MFSHILEKLKSRSLTRQLRPLASAQGTHITLNGERVLNFSSNDYLGLANHPDVIQAAHAALDQWGTGSGASRLISGSLGIHHELEKSIAHYKREERALSFSSGFAANLGTIAALVGSGDTIWVDRFSHASIVDAARLSGAHLQVYPHGNLEFLNKRLAKSKGKVLVVTDSYFSMDGDIIDLQALLSICRKNAALVMIDEAHATGIFGPSGRGLTEAQQLEGKFDAVMGTFSKTFGSVGGFVCGKADLINLLINKARTFIYSTGGTPAASAAAVKAIQICELQQDLRIALWRNIDYLRAAMHKAQLNVLASKGPIIPLLVNQTDQALKLSQELLRRHILIPAIRPPTVPKGTDRLRITVSAKHTREDLDQLVKTLKEIM